MPHWLELGSRGLIALVAITLSICLIWTLILFPLRLSRRNGTIAAWKVVLTQFISTIVSIILSLMMVVLVLNRQNDWFPTWSSLVSSPTLSTSEIFGADGSAPVQPSSWVRGHPTGPQADPRKNPAFGDHQWSDEADIRSRGEYITVTIAGVNSHTPAQQALIWLPPSYLDNPDRFYPVILAFPGIPGSINSYQHDMHIDSIITSLSNEKSMREAIVVVPTVFPNNRDTECVNSTDGSVKMESYITDDVTSWIKTNLRAVDKKEAWTPLGYSAGGWCSSMVTMRHPDRYPTSINLSGYFEPLFDESDPLVSPDDPSYSLGHIAETEAPEVKIFYWCAHDDDRPIAQLDVFKTQVQKPTSLNVHLLDNGGHTWPVWVDGATQGLRWLATQSDQFAWEQA